MQEVQYRITNALIRHRLQKFALAKLNKVLGESYSSLSEALLHAADLKTSSDDKYLVIEYLDGNKEPADFVKVLKTIAPYIHSSASFQGRSSDDWFYWRYVFEDGCLVYESGEIVYSPTLDQ